jgi:2'-5' RNA ligase
MSDPLYRAGSTALLAVVPEVEAVVGAHRTRFDASAAAGVPAHVTVLVPFLAEEQVDGPVDAALRAIIGAHPPIVVTFAGFGRFPHVLYLRPEPDQPFRALTEALAARWPETPPYGGQFDDVVPHLTVAHNQPRKVLAQVSKEIAPRLPLTARVSAVALMVCDGTRWTPRTEYPLEG